MSWLGMVRGRPLAGDRMLLVDSIRVEASIWASTERGTWTAIWSPSKSALKAAQTRGWIWMALPSTRMGSKAWMPSRCRVGARLSRMGCSRITSSRMSRKSQTSGRSCSCHSRATLTLGTRPSFSSLWKMKGLNSSRAIFLGRPHWFSLSSGPTTMTERPE